MTYPAELTEFWREHIRDIGESLDDFYHDYQYWKTVKQPRATDEQAFPQYAAELEQKWQRIRGQK